MTDTAKAKSSRSKRSRKRTSKSAPAKASVTPEKTKAARNQRAKKSVAGKASKRTPERTKLAANAEGTRARGSEKRRAAKGGPRDRVRLFGLGFPKSGTTTLHRAFQRAGFVSAHWRVGERYCGEMIYEDFRAGKNPLRQLEIFDCITQPDVCRPKQRRDGQPLNFWPQLDFELIEAIRAANPGIKFILNKRDIDDLVRSISNWTNLRNRLVASDIIGLPAGKGTTDAELRSWVEGHYQACATHFKDNPDFLEFEISDPKAHEKVQAFAGRDLPWWGVANANQGGDRAERLKARKVARTKRREVSVRDSILAAAVDLSSAEGKTPTLREIAKASKSSPKDLKAIFPTRQALDEAVSAMKSEIEESQAAKGSKKKRGRRRKAGIDPGATLRDVPAYLVPEQLVSEARGLAGSPVALYVPDGGGTQLVRLAGSGDFPEQLQAPTALGPELVADGLTRFQRGLEEALPRCTAMPLRIRDRVPGILICMGSAKPLAPLSEPGAAALELAGVYTDTIEVTRHKGSGHSSVTAQQHMLPPRIAQIAGAQIAADVIPSAKSGGDWFDYADNESGAWLALADVLDSGPAAPGLGAASLGAFRAARYSGSDLAEAANSVHRVIRSLTTGKRGSTVGAIFARWHAPTATLTWINCGAPQAYIADEAGVLTELDGPALPALGSKGFKANGSPNIVRLDPGFRLVMVSDGTLERTSPPEEPPGPQGLEKAIRSTRRLAATSAALAIQRAAVAHRKSDDDAAFLVMSVG